MKHTRAPRQSGVLVAVEVNSASCMRLVHHRPRTDGFNATATDMQWSKHNLCGGGRNGDRVQTGWVIPVARERVNGPVVRHRAHAVDAHAWRSGRHGRHQGVLRGRSRHVKTWWGWAQARPHCYASWAIEIRMPRSTPSTNIRSCAVREGGTKEERGMSNGRVLMRVGISTTAGCCPALFGFHTAAPRQRYHKRHRALSRHASSVEP